MYRIDNSTAAAAMPAISAAGPHVDAFFTDGDPATATPSTIVPAEWLNSFQEELCRLAEGAGVTLVKGSLDQLRLALDYLAQKNEATYVASTTAANTYVATLDPAPLAYTDGMGVMIKFTHKNTSSGVTINLNTLGAKNVKRYDGSLLALGDIADDSVVHLVYNGTEFRMINSVLSQFFNYAASTTAANTYTATMINVPTSYVEGMLVWIKFTNKNTGAATINLNALGAKSIKRQDGTALTGGEICDGMIALMIYDGTNFQILNRRPIPPQITVMDSGSGTYTTPLGALYLKVRMCAGAGGSLGSWKLTTPSNASDGQSTTFGTAFLTCTGGGGAFSGGTGGTGGTATGGDYNYAGINGGAGVGSAFSSASFSLQLVGGYGGGCVLFGGGTPHKTGGSTVGTAGLANSGCGAAGAGLNANVNPASSGGGGGGGGSLEKRIDSPAATYDWVVGDGGNGSAAGDSGYAGAKGGSGRIIVEAHFQ
jgi:hypothetical protein